MAKKRKEETIREKLIGAIIEYSSDELEKQDWMEIATLDEEQLVNHLISILDYYADQYNS